MDELITATPQEPETLPELLPEASLDPLDRERVQQALRASRSDNTRRTYASAWRAWEAWAHSRGKDASLPPPEAIAAYLTERADTGASLSTVTVARAAIRAEHVDHGLPDPTDHEGVRQAMSGIARQIGRSQQQVSPITFAELTAIAVTTPKTKEGRRDLALIGTMRDGLLRRGEAAALTWGDVSYEHDGSGRLHVRHSKTDQEGAGAVLYLTKETAVRLMGMRSDLDAEPALADSLFRMSGRTISRRIANAARRAGLEGHYSGHSPRIGTTIELAAKGCDLPALMTAGRWSSPSMPARYTRGEAAGRGAVARYLEVA